MREIETNCEKRRERVELQKTRTCHEVVPLKGLLCKSGQRLSACHSEHVYATTYQSVGHRRRRSPPAARSAFGRCASTPLVRAESPWHVWRCPMPGQTRHRTVLKGVIYVSKRLANKPDRTASAEPRTVYHDTRVWESVSFPFLPGG